MIQPTSPEENPMTACPSTHTRTPATPPPVCSCPACSEGRWVAWYESFAARLRDLLGDALDLADVDPGDLRDEFADGVHPEQSAADWAESLIERQ